jgi:hypothetical protein
MNYGELKSTLTAWSKRADLAAVLPSIVLLSQERMNRDLLLAGMIASSTLTTTAGNESVALPSGWLKGLSLDIEGAGLEYRTSEELRSMFPDAYSGRPSVYTVEGSNLILGPKPDTVYNIRARYYQKLLPFTSDASTDYVLTNHSSVYLAAGMVEIALYTMDDQLAAFWEPRYQSFVRDANKSDSSAGTGGTVLRMKGR